MNTYIKTAKLQGYRTLKDVKVNFSPGLNIIIGKNGSGKTNFMSFFNDCLNQNYDNVTSFVSELEFGGERNFSFRAKRDLKDISPSEFLKDTLINDNILVSIIEPNSGPIDKVTGSKDVKKLIEENSLGIPHTQFIKHGVDSSKFDAAISSPLSFDLEIGKENPNSIDLFTHFRKASGCSFSTALFLHLIIDVVLNKSEDDVEEELGYTTKVINVFNYFCEIINQDINKYLPIEEVRLNPAYKLYKDEDKKILKFQGLIFDFKFNGDWLPFSSLSDGTKRLFYLFAEICFIPTYNPKRKENPSSNGIILVEEPELGIHPHQFHLIMDFLREVAIRNQVIITTHSPQALDAINESELDSINICSFNSEEGTTIRKLDKSQIDKAKEYMNDMYLSDYWIHSDLENLD